MTPKNPYRMPLREKVALGTLVLVAVWALAWLTIPDADADTPAPPVIQHCHTTDNLTCDPATWLLGPTPVPSSSATDWQDLMLPPKVGA